jgi:hypothetical protein
MAARPELKAGKGLFVSSNGIGGLFCLRGTSSRGGKRSVPARQQADRDGAPHSAEVETGLSQKFLFRGGAPRSEKRETGLSQNFRSGALPLPPKQPKDLENFGWRG